MAIKDMTIKRKLVAVITLACAVALGLASTSFIIYQNYMLKTALVQDLASLAKITGSNNTAAIVFDDADSAKETLASLKEKPSVVTAVVYLENGTVFASYMRDESGVTPPRTHPEFGEEYIGDFLYLTRPVILDNNRIGAILLISDLKNLHFVTMRSITVVIIVMGISLIAAIFISLRLQSVVSGPVMDLALVAKGISKNKDYSVRSNKRSNDEVGELVDAFNEMLEQIQKRDHDLKAYSGKLAQKVEERTLELMKLNRMLKDELLERKKIEGELLLAKNTAEEASRAKSEFLANVSHEIRTPMNSIVGFADILLHGDLTDDQRNSIAMIRQGSDILMILINDILDLSKIEAGMLELEIINFDLEHLAHEVTGFVRARATGKPVDVVCETGGKPLPVMGDPTRLRQVLINILDNAIKFTNEGEVVASVDLISKIDGRVLVQFSVRDTGIGIDEDKLKIIFEDFSQADSSVTRNYGGTGLGLSISRRLVRMMGGEIRVESRPAHGTMFSFSLWFEAGSGQSRELKAPIGRGGALSTSRPLHLLLAEDNELNLQVATRMLHLLGHTTDTAHNGVRAVEMGKAGGYDLIFMDMQMPELDGLEAARELRKAGVTIPIIALTANAMKGDREQCLTAGMDEYITKPLSLDIIKQALAMFTGFNAGHDLQKNKPTILKPQTRRRNSEFLPAAVAKEMGLSLDVYFEFCDRFHAKYKERIAGIEKAVGERDFEVMGLIAHTIRGGALSLRLVEVASSSELLENAAKDKNAAHCMHCLGGLRDAMDKTALLIEKFKN